ncbi:MAG TPA: hypothetical protein VGH08_12865 [Chthoniobacterales bacterium]
MDFKIFQRGIIIVAAVFELSSAGHSFAQEDAARIETQQAVTTRDQTAIGEQPATGEITDPELGDISLVMRLPRPKMFSFSTSQSLNFTSNAFLVEDHAQNAFFWNGRADVSFIPYATRDFTPRLTFEQNWFRYDHFSELDFDSQSLQLDARYNLTRDRSWFFDGSYALTRLCSQHPSIGEFYKFGFLNASVTHVGSITSLPISFGISGGAYWRHGEPSTFDRIAPYLSALAIYNFCPTVQLSGFIRPEWQFYTNDPNSSSRQDFNLSVGTTLSWTPVEYVTLAASVAYIGNFSSVGNSPSVGFGRYDVVTPGIVVAARIAF